MKFFIFLKFFSFPNEKNAKRNKKSLVTIYYVTDGKNKLIRTSEHSESLFLLVGYNDGAYDNHNFKIPPYKFPSVSSENHYNDGIFCVIDNQLFTQDVLEAHQRKLSIDYKFKRVDGNLCIVVSSEHFETCIDVSDSAYQRDFKFKYGLRSGMINDIYLGYYRTLDDRGCTTYLKI